MSINSLIFIWVFVPIFFTLYLLCKDKFKNIILVVASFLFYAWGEPIYIIILIVSIIMNYLFGIVIDKRIKRVELKKIILILGVLFNVSLLAYYKYSYFFIDIVNKITNSTFTIEKSIPLPIGISFFTFKSISYLVDIYKKKIQAEKNIVDLAVYISFFPQITAGPISQYKDIKSQLKNLKTDSERIIDGARLFIFGLSKKILIANTIAFSADKIFDIELNQLTWQMAWLGAITYTLQIYFDFSGYSDMSIGLSKAIGVDVKENFNYPYISKTIQEFWQRWHISLGSWFKEYIYIPLGGNRKGKVRTYVNLLVVFFLTGLWHGANWTFIIWGLWHGFFQIMERLWLKKKVLDRSSIVAHIYSLFVVIVGWTIFKIEDLGRLLYYLTCMFIPWHHTQSIYGLLEFFSHKSIVIGLLSLLFCGFIKYDTDKFKGKFVDLLCCACLLILCILSMISNTYNPFIYLKF